jgi:hypothetical protein
MRRFATSVLPLLAALGLAMCSKSSDEPVSAEQLRAMIARYAPTVITADTRRLSDGDRQALGVLVRAAELMDSLYLRQVWSGNVALKHRLAEDTSEVGRLRYRYYLINMGPWSSLDDGAAFVAGVPAHHPPCANYYPEDMTREEFERWVATLSAEQQARARGYFTTIRRAEDGSLHIVPYSQEYAALLGEAAELLEEAARLTDNATLRDFLVKRARAFRTDDYYESDVAWMMLDSPIDVTIGPYEVYMDSLFNYKAAFEAFITLRNEEETARLAMFADHLQEIENNLPIDPKYRNPKLGAFAPIRVVDEVIVGGEANRGVQTAAFNLPNDERVVSAMGSKRVMLKNVQEAKFNTVLRPIAARVLAESQRRLVAFEPFFTHILTHELMHGLGPHTITVDGRETTVRLTMKELGSAFEEAKADIAGLFALQYLIDHGVLPKEMERPLYATFLAGVFRSVRFGIHEAHGKGMALQFNYLLEKGAFITEPGTGLVAVDFDRIADGVRALTGEIMTVQARGDYEAARRMLETYGVITPALARALEGLDDIPVDIAPEFPVAVSERAP